MTFQLFASLMFAEIFEDTSKCATSKCQNVPPPQRRPLWVAYQPKCLWAAPPMSTILRNTFGGGNQTTVLLVRNNKNHEKTAYIVNLSCGAILNVNWSKLLMWSNFSLLNMIKLLHMTSNCNCVTWCKIDCHVEKFWSTWQCCIVMWSKIAPHEILCSTDNVCSVWDNYDVWRQAAKVQRICWSEFGNRLVQKALL